MQQTLLQVLFQYQIMVYSFHWRHYHKTGWCCNKSTTHTKKKKPESNRVHSKSQVKEFVQCPRGATILSVVLWLSKNEVNIFSNLCELLFQIAAVRTSYLTKLFRPNYLINKIIKYSFGLAVPGKNYWNTKAIVNRESLGMSPKWHTFCILITLLSASQYSFF